MAVQPIVLMGEKVLRERSAEVDPTHIASDEFQRFLADMRETAQQNPEEGFITAGLAAPQIGVPLRVFLALHKGVAGKHPTFDIYINPQLEFPSLEMVESEESCLSTPHLCGVVNRYTELRVSYLNEKGERIREKVNGDLATFIQHEYDHLDGILWIDRVVDTKTIRFC